MGSDESRTAEFTRSVIRELPLSFSHRQIERTALRSRRISLSIPLRLGSWQEFTRGVYRYAKLKNWVVSLHSGTNMSKALAGKPDGVIASVESAESARKLLDWGGPVVDAAGKLENSPFAQIGFDPLATGKLAADHLLLLGGRCIASIGNGEDPINRLIRRSFVDRVSQAGLEALEVGLSYDLSNYTACLSARAALAGLSKLTYPAAVFCFHDLLAHSLAAASLSAGLKVPHDIAILGCLNDEFLCNVSQPPLSSIGMPFAAAGFEAARLLDELMAARPVPARTELPPLGVVTRESTDPAALAEPALAAALRFIRENAAKRIGVEDITAASGMSRSSLERRFRAVVGRSPLAELLRERVDRAQHLLVETDLALKEIASAAGFHDVRHFLVTFRLKAGVTPGKFRSRFRPR